MKLPEDPKLKTTDILTWLYRNRTEGFTVRDVVQQFGLQRGEAQRRINYMRQIWGAAKILGEIPAHRRGRREIKYILTVWGQRYGSRAAKAGRRK